MALVVEDGTGKADAESYVSVADCSTYAVARGLSFATSPENTSEAALRRATQWVEATYGPRYPGERTNGRSQALGWPRLYAYDAADDEIASDEIPVEIVNATCEAAVRELAVPGSMSPDLKRGGAIRRVKAGSVEVEYAGNATATTVFSTIDGILSGLLGARSMYTARAARA